MSPRLLVSDFDLRSVQSACLACADRDGWSPLEAGYATSVTLRRHRYDFKATFRMWPHKHMHPPFALHSGRNRTPRPHARMQANNAEDQADT